MFAFYAKKPKLVFEGNLWGGGVSESVTFSFFNEKVKEPREHMQSWRWRLIQDKITQTMWPWIVGLQKKGGLSGHWKVDEMLVTER